MSSPVSPRDPARDRLLGIGAVCLASLGLSAGSSMVRLSGSPGPVVAFWRLTIAALIWQAVLAVKGKRLTKSDLQATLRPGIFFGINLSLFFFAVSKTRIAHAEFIGSLAPLLVVPISVRQLGERVPRQVVMAAAFALPGIALILFFGDVQKRGSASLLGDLVCLGAVGTWVSYLFASRSSRKTLSVDVFMAGMSAISAAVVLPIAFLTGHLFDATTKGWLLFVVIGIVSGVTAHGLLAWAQRTVPLSTMSMMQLSQPGLAVAWSWMLLSERVNGIQIIGMAIVIAAVGAVARLSAGPSVSGSKVQLAKAETA